MLYGRQLVFELYFLPETSKMSFATQGLQEAIAGRLPSGNGRTIRGVKLSEVAPVVLTALLRGEKEYLDLPKVVRPGNKRYQEQLRWIDIPRYLDRYPTSDNVIEAIFTAMLVEDHLPGYAKAYQKIFPTEGEKNPRRHLLNRVVMDFVQMWTFQENGHAIRLRYWLLLSNRVDPLRVIDDMVETGAKYYKAPGDTLAKLFAYTVIQEAGTKIFYDAILKNVDEPVLASNLRYLSRQESQHGQAFRALLTPILERGGRKEYAEISQVLQDFAMPMANMMRNYRRRAINMRRTANGYDHRQSLETLEALAGKVANARPGNRDHPVHQLLDYIATLCPPRKKTYRERVLMRAIA